MQIPLVDPFNPDGFTTCMISDHDLTIVSAEVNAGVVRREAVRSLLIHGVIRMQCKV